MSKRLTYLMTFFDAGKPQYEEGKTYPADENSERHVKAGYAAYEKKPQTQAEKDAEAAQKTAEAATAQKLIDDARAAAVLAKALEIAQLNQVQFDALDEAIRNQHLEAADKLVEKAE